MHFWSVLLFSAPRESWWSDNIRSGAVPNTLAPGFPQKMRSVSFQASECTILYLNLIFIWKLPGFLTVFRISPFLLGMSQNEANVPHTWLFCNRSGCLPLSPSKSLVNSDCASISSSSSSKRLNCVSGQYTQFARITTHIIQSHTVSSLLITVLLPCHRHACCYCSPAYLLTVRSPPTRSSQVCVMCIVYIMLWSVSGSRIYGDPTSDSSLRCSRVRGMQLVYFVSRRAICYRYTSLMSYSVVRFNYYLLTDISTAEQTTPLLYTRH